jgi:spore coat polysaccharide biosynthesis predicted glycosyltransferase SpsG
MSASDIDCFPYGSMSAKIVTRFLALLFRGRIVSDVTWRIAFRCDSGQSIGAGHVMRSLALAEALSARGHAVELFADLLQLDWVAAEAARRGLPVRPPPTTPQECTRAFANRFDAVAFDSYLLATEAYRATRRAVAATLALVDGDLRGAEADLLVDQNPGAELDRVDLPAGATRLAGLSYALVRSEIRAARPAADALDGQRDDGPPRVLVIFGGTDAHGVAPRVAAGLLDTGVPVRIRAIGARPELREAMATLSPGAAQHLEVLAPRNDVPRLIRESELVIGAAGTSAVEFLTLGACAALVCVADNQAPGYTRLVELGVVTGLGALDSLATPALPRTMATVARLLGDPAARRRLARAAWELVDGAGAERVADALEARLRSAAERATRDPR